MKNNAAFFILCFLITSNFTTLHSGFAAGTLVKVPRGYSPIENLHVGDFVYSVTPNRTYNLAQITHTTSYSLPAAIKIITENDIIITAPQQRFYLPREQKWITANQISSSCHLGTGKTPCTTKFKIQSAHTVTDFFDIRLNNFHTFCVSTDDIIVHNFPLCFIGFTIAWGTGKICFDGIYAGICLAGFWIGTKLLKNNNKNSNTSNIKIQPFISTGGAPDPNDDNWFEKLKTNYIKKGRTPRFGNIYKNSKDGLWYSKAKGGENAHGGEHYKVFEESSKGLNYIHEVDHLGKIIPKHKGPIGIFISYKEIIFY